MKRYILPILVLLALGLAGCGPKGPSELVNYRRTGGIAGLDDRLTIDVDGNAQLSQRSGTTAFTIGPGPLKQMMLLFDRSGFAKLKPEYLPADKCCDLFDYRVTYKGQTVHTMDTAIPTGLQPILDVLNRFIEEHGKR